MSERSEKSSNVLANLRKDALSIVRLGRVAADLQLSHDLRNSLRYAVLDGIDSVFSEVKSRETLAPTRMKPTVNKPDPYSSWTVEKLEYHIRRAVEADVAWDKIEPYAWKMFDIDPSAVMAGRIVELAFLQGHLPAAISVMESLVVTKVRYFQHIHERLKTPLIINLWCRTEVSLLEHLVDMEPDAAGLTDLERYFVFWHSLHGDDPGRPLMYFQKYKVVLFAAAREFGEKVGFPESRFLYVLGRLHLEMGMEENARQLLEKISPEHKEYTDALEVLLKLKITKNSLGQSLYAAKLNAESDWKKRILLFRSFLAESRRLGGFRDPNRPALNELLIDPLKWFPRTADAWTELSGLLADNLDLMHIIPELTRVYRESAMMMHPPELDKAIWSGPLQYLSPHKSLTRYLIGVAKLHYYLATGSSTSEDALWEAKDHINMANDAMNLPMANPWQDYHRFAYQQISKCIYITEKNRDQMLRQLKVATDPRLLAMSDVTQYLDECHSPSSEVLTNLQYIARDRKQNDVEIDIILRRASQMHLTNRDLENIWMLAVKGSRWDLAWRAISVLQFRGSIKESLRQAWLISGEKRSYYPMINVSKKHIWSHFDDFTPDCKRLVHACFEVGPYLPDVLHLLDNGSKVSKLRSYRADSIEAKSVNFLNCLPWLPIPKRQYQFSLDGATKTSNNLPAFLSTLPGNQWCFLLLELANRFGITSWNWQLSRLYNQIENIIPRLINRQDLMKSSSKIAKWMRQLSPEARSAWYDIAKLSANIPDDMAMTAMYRFLIRLTTLLCVNHVEALKSLYAMKVPVYLIWEFEHWILSQKYSGYRASLGLESKVSVPRSLRDIEILTSS